MVPFERIIQVTENYYPYLSGQQITCTHGVCTCNLFLKNERDVIFLGVKSLPFFHCMIYIFLVHEHIPLILCIPHKAQGWVAFPKYISYTSY